MTIDFTLRPVTHDDIKAVSLLAQRSFTESFGHLYTPENLQAHLDSKCSDAFFADAMGQVDCTVMVAVDDAGDIIGYSKFGALEVPVSHPVLPCLELHRLYVAKAHKGKGIGKALMRHFIEAGNSADCRALYLGVYSGNPDALTFYAKQSFVKVGEYNYPVGTQLDREYIMMRNV